MEIETIPNAAPPTEAKKETAAPAVAAGDDGAGKESKSENSPAERKFKLKYGKQERELSEKELIAEAQKGWAADERFQEAARIKREVTDAIKNGNVAELIKKFKGKDELEYAKEVLRSHLKKAQMTPEEREAEERQERIDKLKKEEEELLTRKQKAELEQATKHYEEQYDRDLSAAIEKHKLPKTHAAIGRAVSIASKIVDMKLEPDWDLVVQEAKRQMVDEYRELFEALEDGSLVEMLGEPLARRVSKALVGKGAPGIRPRAVPAKEEDKFRQEEKEPVDMDEWFAKKRAQFK